MIHIFFLFSGPKFNLTSHKVEALIVEYDSNVTFSFSHDEMSQFYTSVNNWFSTVIKTAPPQLQSGFFLSHLGFYDVQNSLLQDTLMAIGLAMAVAIIVVFASTLNVGLTFLGKICQIKSLGHVKYYSAADSVYQHWHGLG